MPNKKKYTVTAALPYANGPLHIGHMAGAYLPADIYVRFLRLMKKEVLFVCGSDENGAAITLKAFEEKTTPKKIIDQFHKTNKNIFEDFGISFDIYHRTSAKLHHKTAQDFFLELHKRGVFETRESLQFYDDSANFFLADRYMMGTCPNCQFEKAYGDQCESCGSSLSLQDLINPVSRLTGKAPIKRRTKHWYLNLGAHQSWLEEWIEKGLYQEELHHDPKAWKSHVLGQCHSWLKAGLSARAMTRDLDWGVDVPLTKAEGKKLYVWLDAPIGYISATKEWAKQKGKNWQDYWQDPNTELVHFIGKDNIVFHCIIFPILLHTH